MEAMLWLVLASVLAAEFVNGWTDAPNAIATVVTTKVMTPRQAVLMAVVLNIVGTFAGTAVAYTIGKGIVDVSVLTPEMILAAMLSLIAWSSFAAYFGIPTSESHALVAGLAGAALAAAGPEALIASGWFKIGIGLVFSLGVGFGLSFLLAKAVILISYRFSAKTGFTTFSRLQIVSSMFVAFNHGLNDGQKFIGIFAMTLVIGGILPHFTIPFWVILLCALVMGIGTSIGGWRIIKKVGIEMVDIQPWQGFSAETGAGLVILGASFWGIPLSTTHCINTAIMGSAAAKKLTGVRWLVASNILGAWALTFPICATLSFLATLLFKSL